MKTSNPADTESYRQMSTRGVWVKAAQVLQEADMGYLLPVGFNFVVSLPSCLLLFGWLVLVMMGLKNTKEGREGAQCFSNDPWT